MNTQQAPSRLQSARVSPVQSALKMAHSSTGGTISQSRYSPTSVSRVLIQLENRLARSQPSAPMLIVGGGRSGLKVWMVMRLPLDQRNALVVPVHQQREIGKSTRLNSSH